MLKNQYNLIGIMSGTSLDGIDMAYIQFNLKNHQWTFDITIAETIAYPDNWQKILKNAITLSNQELQQTNLKYTQFLADKINHFIQKNKLSPIDAICSHGHTIKHQPQLGITLQIGNLPQLATITQQKIICDFRVQDVALGGQGAPLVPIGDKLLFGQYKQCLNLGGFSNISYDVNNQRISYDICPVNIVLNHLVAKVGLTYDNKGQMASQGQVCQALLTALNQLAYYQKPYPKSLGVEWVKTQILPLIKQFSLSLQDQLCTLVEHMACQITPHLTKNEAVLVSGGGVYNDYLINRIIHHAKHCKLVIPNKKIIDYKEALIFAFLGLLKLRNQNNVLASVTGAPKDHCAGIIFNP